MIMTLDALVTKQNHDANVVIEGEFAKQQSQESFLKDNHMSSYIDSGD